MAFSRLPYTRLTRRQTWIRGIPYRNFQGFPPDPHHFDGDRDGIWCES